MTKKFEGFLSLSFRYNVQRQFKTLSNRLNMGYSELLGVLLNNYDKKRQD